MKKLLVILLGTVGTLLAQSYVIDGPFQPAPQEETAIRELTEYLQKRVHGKLTIGGESPVVFQVGDTELARKHRMLSSDFADEQWAIKSFGNQVVLNGGGTRGVLYAVYHFLEDFCDIHWWSDAEEYVPEPSSLTLDALDKSGRPRFMYRDIYRTITSTRRSYCSPVTAVRNRLNRSGEATIPACLGGSRNFGPPFLAHTFERYFPAQEYLKTHPEYFTLIKGKRVGGAREGQLCLTNLEMRQAFLEKLLENIRKGHDDAAKNGLQPPLFYDVSMNDNKAKCECPSCVAEAGKYHHSGLYLNFVNYLARAVKKKYPNIYITTLAYYHTEEPPSGGIRPEDNVVVRLCDTRTNQAASILAPENKVFRDLVAQWAKITKNLFVWDYAITFGFLGASSYPYASEFSYGDLYKFYADHNVSGILWEHEEPHIADMHDLKFFLECKLLEDPYQDVNALIALFMERYYGAAAPYVLEYRKALDTARKKANGIVIWFPSLDSFRFLTNDDIIVCQSIFEKAEAAVSGNSMLFARVRHARCGLDRLTIARCTTLTYHGPQKAEETKVDGAAASRRLLDSLPQWVMRFQDGEKLAAEARKLSEFNLVEKKEYPAPEQFKDRNFYDFTTVDFRNCEKQNIALVKDSDSATGEAFRVDVNAHHLYHPPFAMGLYDSDTKKELFFKNIRHSTEPGYHWYKVTTTALPANGFLFLNRKWTIQLPMSKCRMKGDQFEFWVSAKFTGPRYMNETTSNDCIYVDRVLLVEP